MQEQPQPMGCQGTPLLVFWTVVQEVPEQGKEGRRQRWRGEQLCTGVGRRTVDVGLHGGHPLVSISRHPQLLGTGQRRAKVGDSNHGRCVMKEAELLVDHHPVVN